MIEQGPVLTRLSSCCSTTPSARSTAPSMRLSYCSSGACIGLVHATVLASRLVVTERSRRNTSLDSRSRGRFLLCMPSKTGLASIYLVPDRASPAYEQSCGVTSFLPSGNHISALSGRRVQISHRHGNTPRKTERRSVPPGTYTGTSHLISRAYVHSARSAARPPRWAPLTAIKGPASNQHCACASSQGIVSSWGRAILFCMSWLLCWLPCPPPGPR